MFKYIPLIRAYALNSTVIYDTVDLHWVSIDRAATVTGELKFIKDAAYYKSIESFNVACADITFAISEDEKAILTNEIPGSIIEIIPNIHEVIDLKIPFEARKDLLFVGGFTHQPNEDAVFYFIKKIFPLIKNKLKGIRFFIVGSDPSVAVRKLKIPTILLLQAMLKT